MIKRILTIFVALFFYAATFIHGFAADNNVSEPNCIDGICLEDNSIVLTNDDINALKSLYKKEERPNLEFTSIRLKTVIHGSVYLLSAKKPDYYGRQLVLSKENNKWAVLKRVNSIY